MIGCFAPCARSPLAPTDPNHRLVEFVDTYDAPFIMISFGWLLTIVFLPFATQVAAVYGGHERLAVATYIGTVATSSLCLAALSLLVSRRDALRRDGVSPRDTAPGLAVITGVLMLSAFALGVAIPAVNYWALLLLTLTGPVSRIRWVRALARLG